MTSRISFTQQRIQSLGNWARGVEIPGMDPETYIAIFTHVLESQRDDGCWRTDNLRWAVVMTAVTLQALHALRFNIGDWWPTCSTLDGGIDAAIAFLVEEVNNKDGKPDAIGEDIWDACQVALALKAFGKASDVKSMVGRISQGWSNLYSNAPRGIDVNEWCGPAYLAAMVDVLREYEEIFAADNLFLESLTTLKSAEVRDEEDKVQGYFVSVAGRADIDIWNTGLVLRTLCTVPMKYESLVDRDQIKRTVLWMLEKLLDENNWALDKDRAPMFLARSLHALLVARPWIDGQTRQRIDIALERGNRRLADYFLIKPGPQGNLKSYTAVIEYLSNWTVAVSAGLAFHVRKTLVASAFVRSEPVPRDNGLRIVWLSDLHVGADDNRRPQMGIFKRLARASMWFKGTPLAQHFALRNLGTLLDRVVELNPDHILVTGDVTDFAQNNQFESVSNQFLVTQSKIWGSRAPTGALDPSRWTILPGNHDVTDEEQSADSVRPTLAKFFRYFSRAYNIGPGTNYGDVFPIVKSLSKNGGIAVRLVGLDSTVTSPVWVVGVNARGRIDATQKSKLAEILNDQSVHALTLIALHHHPIVIPELLPALQDKFLSLNEADGRQLIQLAASSGVVAILHGHFHRFSSWSGLAPDGRRMAIVGSSAGALEIPGTKEEFLELREADRDTAAGLQRGLAIYVQRLANGAWISPPVYTGVFLPIR